MKSTPSASASGHRGGGVLALAVMAEAPQPGRWSGSPSATASRSFGIRYHLWIGVQVDVQAPVGRHVEPRHEALEEVVVRARRAVVDRRALRDVARLAFGKSTNSMIALTRPDRPRMRHPVAVEAAVRVRVPVVVVEVRRPEPGRALDLARARRVDRRSRRRGRDHHGHDHRGQCRPSPSAHRILHFPGSTLSSRDATPGARRGTPADAGTVRGRGDRQLSRCDRW